MDPITQSNQGTPERVFGLVANNKGGVGKSLVSALLIEQLAAGPEAPPWDLIEVEHRVEFTQENYVRPPGVTFTPIGLVSENVAANRTELSTLPLDKLWDFIPSEHDTGPRHLLLDLGASAFQAFMMWGVQSRGLNQFLNAGFRFVFFIPVQGGDYEAAAFFNDNLNDLSQLGTTVLVKNFREGADFSLLNPELVAKVPCLPLICKGLPMTNELQQPSKQRLTFRQLAQCRTATRRARNDAGLSDEHFTAAFQALRPQFGL